MPKIRKNLTIFEENFNYIEQIKNERKLSSLSEALDCIIKEHMSNELDTADIIAEKIIMKIEEKYSNVITRCRLGINGADRNSQVMLEMLNSIILNTGMEKSYNTDVIESDILRESRQVVKDRISMYKQIKDNKVSK